MREGFSLKKDFIITLDSEFLRDIKILLQDKEISDKSSIEVKIKNYQYTILLYFTQIYLDSQNFILVNIFDITKNKILESDFLHLQKLQMLGHFLSSIIHDFNNLLTAIIGFSDILLTKNSSSSSSYEDIMQIKKNAIRSSNLVKQLLAFSRKEMITPKLINATTCIADLYQLIRKLLGEKISLSLEDKGGECFIKIDKTQFEQVIINLSVNAKDSFEAKSTNEEGLLTISTYLINLEEKSKILKYFSPSSFAKLVPGQYVLIKIQDNGQGMSEDVLEKIFDPFFSTKNYGLGTGLGLSTISDIVNSVGGHIKVKTDFNVGTSFYLLFPPGKAIKNEKNEKMLEINLKKNNNPNEENKKKKKILVVEDENPVRLVTIQALKYQGYEVLDTSNGLDALKILDQHSDIDLIITDFMMGRMDGIEFIKNIRKKYYQVKIIITTGYTENAISYVKKYKCEFLNKPYSLSVLNEKVFEILK
ncbi:MAG: response regulator [Rickettsia sp.]|nr:response regulator [Rickettsia sp.]